MNKLTVIAILLTAVNIVVAQSITGEELLNRSIEYHDPAAQWSAFKATIELSQDRPNGSSRMSQISADLSKGHYKIFSKSEKSETTFDLNGEECEITWNGKTEFTSEEIEENRLTCERAEMMRNYYIYLYGLPMKLRDPGTIIDEVVQSKEFMGKEYNVLKVTYDEEVGKDIWYFYFDKKTNAMEVYQFYHDEAKNDGEYILLEGELTYGKMKFPKDRTWYMNKDDKLLGTDILVSITNLKK